MAVSIDTVYQKVLAFANKEQRGYITPQEFNLFADQAQMEIFDQYFYDKNQFGRVPGNSYTYSDMVTNLEGKMAIFERRNRDANVQHATSNPNNNPNFIGTWGDVKIGEQFPDMYRLGTVTVVYDTATTGRGYVAEKIPLNDLNEYAHSPLGKWSKSRPVYVEYPILSDNTSRIKIYPYPHYDRAVDRVQFSYIRKPKKPNWGYVVVNDKPLYNSNASTDFELHTSEESELVYKILTSTGVAIEKPQLTQIAAGLEGAKVQQEKK